VEQRGNWGFLGTQVYPTEVWGGRSASFARGQKLLISAGARIYDVNPSTGAATDLAAGPSSMVQNAVKLRDRVYFPDGQGTAPPYVATYDGATVSIAQLPSSAPNGKVALAYKDRLLVGSGADVFYSPLEIDGGPTSAWDPLSKVGTTAEVTGLAGMPGQTLVFHPAMIERIRGSIPPGQDLDSDMYVDTLTDQVGCTEPQTIVSWRENIIFADERGIFITDGATVKNLVEIGGMGDFWRIAYGNRVAGSSVSCGIFLDYLLVTVITPVAPFTLVCDLNARSWMRFTNFGASCYIPSEGTQEEIYCGDHATRRLMTVASMFVDPPVTVRPAPDYIDGNGVPVLGQIATGFKRLGNEEGLSRIRNVLVSYHHQSYVRALTDVGWDVFWRTTPPTPEDLDLANVSVAGWTKAGTLPDVGRYSRKKLPVGQSAFGVMVLIKARSNSRTSRLYSVGIERTQQDRGKVTS
jgi:hypothetical protein